MVMRGKLTTWKDDRGFGFIQPAGGGKDVFLHITALKGAGRRPKVGDTILYERVTTSDGKIRAARASIQGVVPQRMANQRKNRQGNSLKVIIGSVLLGIAVLFAIHRSPSYSPSPITAITQPDCVIKGNISINTGKKWYHLPGMEDYESTVISPDEGEKWFCSEEEARENGWSKAPN
ncbi:MAG: cold shock domain-containing protein [Cyanobacteria bacterium P01_D01_bin.156]